MDRRLLQKTIFLFFLKFSRFCNDRIRILCRLTHLTFSLAYLLVLAKLFSNSGNTRITYNVKWCHI